jgi:hypothetical protein
VRDSYANLAYVRKRYRAARQRALYWSGNMTFTGHRWVVNGPHRHDHELQYEMAMDDCRSLEGDIERLSGRSPKPYDPNALNGERWARLIRHIQESLP